MARIFITGSSDGLGTMAADGLLRGGHHVIVHARNRSRLEAVRDLIDRGAMGVVADLAVMAEVRGLANDVNTFGVLDAVIHNAGVSTGSSLIPVNIVAPYLLTALMQRPRRLIYLSSSMHTGGRARLSGINWNGADPAVTYSDTKLFVTTLSAAVARLWPDVMSNAVDPGWVPTKMGGPHASDDLEEGHRTQEWLATSDEPRALTSGGYWRHQKRGRPHAAVTDVQFQNALLEALGEYTGAFLK
jgi:NAD(P)-dependent dehydrogenase (short-subunit alcohol dehydrogenase family)